MKQKIAVFILTFLIVLAGCTTSKSLEPAEPSKKSTADEAVSPVEEESKEESQEPEEPQTISEDEPAKLAEEKITFKVFADVKPNIEDMATNLQTEWYEEKTNVHIEWEIPATELETKLNLSLASGDYPDMYWNIGMTPAQVIMYSELGVLAPINPYLPEHGKSYQKILDENPEIKAAVTAPDGNIYSFIRTDGGYHMLSNSKMFVYEPWLEALDMEMPTTTETFKDFLIQVRDTDLNENGDMADEIPLIGRSGDVMLNYLISAFEVLPSNPKLNVKEDEVYAAFLTEEYREGLAYVKDLYDEGLLARDSFVQNADQLKALVSRPEEMIVAAAPGMYELSFGDRTSMPTVLEDFTAMPPLEGPSGQAITPYGDNFLSFNTFVTSACENPEIAVAWNDFFMSPAGEVFISMGFEGEQHAWVDEPSFDGNTPSFKMIYETIEGLQNDWWYASGPRYQTAANRYGQVSDPTQLEYHLYNESIKYIDSFPEEYLPKYLWMTAEQANEVSLVESVILEYVDEAATKFIIGDMSLESDWDTYLSNLSAMGLEQWLAVYKEAYSNYVA